MSEEALEKTSSVLPEAWYDLIARIVPGALAVFITFKKLPSSSNQLGGLVIGLVIFYVVGIFLDIFSEWTIARLRGPFGLPDTSGLSPDFWRERGRLSPSQWQVVSKMNAEADLFKAFSAYFGMQVVLGFVQFVCRESQLSCRKALKPFLDPADLSNLRIMPILLSIVLCFFCILAWRRFSKAAESRRQGYERRDGDLISAVSSNE